MEEPRAASFFAGSAFETATFFLSFLAPELLLALAGATDELFFFTLTTGFLVLLKLGSTPKGPEGGTPNSEPFVGIRQIHP